MSSHVRRMSAGEYRFAMKIPQTQRLYSMLPSDWATMHWVKKEQWIKAQMDKKLLEYLISVESVNAVLNACKERLKKLES